MNDLIKYNEAILNTVVKIFGEDFLSSSEMQQFILEENISPLRIFVEDKIEKIHKAIMSSNKDNMLEYYEQLSMLDSLIMLYIERKYE